MAGNGDGYLESKKTQYEDFKRILFWAGLAILISTFGVLWIIS